MAEKLLIGLICLAVLMTAGCKKDGVSLVTAGLRDRPTDEKGSFKWVKGLNRGQAVKIVDEEKDTGWVRVQLADGETEGWIQKSCIHYGTKRTVEFTAKTALYDQPDPESKLRYTVPVGTRALLLKEKGPWANVSINWGMDGWVRKGTYQKGAENRDVSRKKIDIRGIGKCRVEASSALPDSGGYTFSPENLFDRNPATTWQVGDGGYGAWVEIVFPGPVNISVSLINGFVRVDRKFAHFGADGDLYVLNNRVKSLKVETWDPDDRHRVSQVSFGDETRDYQDAGVYQNVEKIRFTIEGIYRGTKWNDTALAEIGIRKE